MYSGGIRADKQDSAESQRQGCGQAGTDRQPAHRGQS